MSSVETTVAPLTQQRARQQPDDDAGGVGMESNVRPVATDTDPLLGNRIETAPESESTKWSNRHRLLHVGPGLLLITFAIGFDITFVSTNYSRRIASDLHELDNAVWIVLAGSIAETSTQPLYAHVSNLYGQRLATLIGASVVTIGLLLCAMSERLWQLTMARVVVGCGSSGLQLLVVIIINDFVQLRNLQLWRSIVIATQTGALMLGGPLGTLLMDASSWQATFGVECGFMLLAGAVLYFTLNLPPIKWPSGTPLSKRVDYMGAVTLFVAVAAPLFAINTGGSILPWNHYVVILLLATTPFLFGILYAIESRYATTPIIPVKLARIPAAIAVIVCAFPIVFAFNQVVYQFSLYVEARSFEEESRFSDWALTFIFLGRPIGAVLSGWYIRRFQKYKLLFRTNLAVTVLLFLLYALGFIYPQDPRYSPFLILLGFNIGISEGCLLVSLLSVVGKEDQPALYAVFDLALALAGDLGIAVSLSFSRFLAQRNLSKLLSDESDAEEIIRDSLESLDHIRELPQNLRSKVLQAITSSIESVFLLSCTMIIISFAATFYMRELSTQAAHSSRRTPRPHE